MQTPADSNRRVFNMFHECVSRVGLIVFAGLADGRTPDGVIFVNGFFRQRLSRYGVNPGRLYRRHHCWLRAWLIASWLIAPWLIAMSKGPDSVLQN